MEILVAEEQGNVAVTRFAVTGAFNAEEPLTKMAKEAYERGARNILIDMTNVTYMSSAGLKVLHNIYTLLRDADESSDKVNRGLQEGSYYAAHIKLLKPSKMVQEVLRISGYDMFIESFDDLKKAVDSFGG